MAETQAFEMQERKEPQFTKFAEGQTVEGVLVKIYRIQVGDPEKPEAPKRPATKYTVLEGQGELVSFLGSYDLDTKLNTRDVGHFIQIRYEGEDKTVSRNGNAMKKFRVRVSNKPAQVVDGTLITDDDIPF